MTSNSTRTTVLLAVALMATGADADECDAPDISAAKCRCNGELYDFSQVRPSDGNSYFHSPDANNEYMYYFRMSGGGLSADAGAMPCVLTSVADAGAI
jgi:hypothetical protein